MGWMEWEHLSSTHVANFSDTAQYYQLYSLCYTLNPWILFILQLKSLFPFTSLTSFPPPYSPWQLFYSVFMSLTFFF